MFGMYDQLCCVLYSYLNKLVKVSHLSVRKLNVNHVGTPLIKKFQNSPKVD